MLKITESAGNERPPPCARCGGTGYVYLWSVSALGARVWFCNRNSCKLFWHDAGRMAAIRAKGALPEQELEPLVSRTDQPALQTV